MGGEFLNAFTVGDQLLWGAAEPLRRMLRIPSRALSAQIEVSDGSVYQSGHRPVQPAWSERAIIKLLADRKFPVGELFVLASENGAGSKIAFAGKTLTVRTAEDFDFSQVEVALFAAGASVSQAPGTGCGRRSGAGWWWICRRPTVMRRTFRWSSPM